MVPLLGVVGSAALDMVPTAAVGPNLVDSSNLNATDLVNPSDSLSHCAARVQQHSLGRLSVAGSSINI